MKKVKNLQMSKDNGAVGTVTEKEHSVNGNAAPFDSKKKKREQWKLELEEEFKKRGI